jgi:hypothetical protein
MQFCRNAGAGRNNTSNNVMRTVGNSYLGSVFGKLWREQALKLSISMLDKRSMFILVIYRDIYIWPLTP